MVSRVQNFFLGLPGENEVPNGTSQLFWSYGITNADKFYTRIPSTEALENFLTNKVRLLQGTDQGEGNYGSEDRDMPEEIGEYVMSEESGNMRRLWEACKTVSTDDIRAQARGSNLGGNETRGRMVVEDLFRRATEAGLTFSSDKTKPGLKTVQIVVKNLSTNGDFIHMEWELYNNEADELRALRLHRQRQAAGSGSTGAKIVLDPADHSSLLLMDPTLQVPKRATVSTIVALQDVLELRANAHDVAQQVPAPVYSEFHAKLLRLYRAEVPPGFRPPTLLEIRKVDRDVHEELFRWVAVGSGQLADGLSAYTAGPEKDSPLWAPSLPVEARLPDRGAEAVSNAKQPAIWDGSSFSGPLPLTKDGRDLGRVCRVCKYPLGDHSNLRFCKEPSKNKGGKGGQQDNRHRARPPRRKGDGKNQGSGHRPRGPPPPCSHWMPEVTTLREHIIPLACCRCGHGEDRGRLISCPRCEHFSHLACGWFSLYWHWCCVHCGPTGHCRPPCFNCHVDGEGASSRFTRTPDAYSPNPGADICLDFNKPDKKCRGRKCTRCHDCPRVMPDGSMCGKKHPSYEHV